MSLIASSAGCFSGPDFRLIFAPNGYDDPEILSSRKPSICLTSPDGGHVTQSFNTTIARRLASEGAGLILTDISLRKLNATADSLRSDFPDVHLLCYRSSVLEVKETKALIDEAQKWTNIDILVNVVGGMRSGPFEVPLLQMDEERWYGTFDINLKGIYYLVRGLAPAMQERKYGRIVNISSVSYTGDGRQPEYAAAKAAVASLTRGIALELAPNVTANCVAPGIIGTSILEYVDPKFVQNYVSRVPLQRPGRPDEIAAAVAFLASDDASYLTGVILPVSGGIWPSLWYFEIPLTEPC